MIGCFIAAAAAVVAAGSVTFRKLAARRRQRPRVTLYTATTMNGWKASIVLEELGVPYQVVHLDFGLGQQRAPDYVRDVNPNGRIPAIVDHANGDMAVAETAALMIYLAERCGSRLWPRDPRVRAKALQWMFWQMSGLGPMMGQAMYFQRIAAPKGHVDDFAIERYVGESKRLLGVLDSHLAGRTAGGGGPYMMGSEYTLVDICCWTYAATAFWGKISLDEFPAVQAWVELVKARPAVQKGITVPKPNPAFFGEGDIKAAVHSNQAMFKSKLGLS